jgi:mRNA-degrading endonuclease HigB of HigAB toxin-antitoxin module
MLTRENRIGGNKYRLIASVDFMEEMLVIERVLTHEDYDREVV